MKVKSCKIQKMSSFKIQVIFDKLMKALRLSGMLQTSESSKKYRAYGMFIHIFIFELFIALELMNLIKTNKTDNRKRGVDKVAIVLTYIPTLIAMVIKSINFPLQYKKLKNVIVKIDDLIDKEFFEGEKLKKTKKKFEKIMVFLIIFGTMISFGILVAPIRDHKLSRNVWIPENSFLERSELVFWSLAIYQFVAISISALVNQTFDLVPYLLLSYVIALLKELRNKFDQIQSRNSVESNDKVFEMKQKRAKEFINFIELHKQIVEITKEIEEMFGSIIVFQAIISSIILCTCLFTINIMTKKEDASLLPTATLYAIVMLFQIYMPSFLGNEIKLESQKIPEKIFHSDWYLEDHEHKKIVKIFLELTKKPITIRGFGFVVIDLQTFMKVYDAAYSLYAVFENRKQKQTSK